MKTPRLLVRRVLPSSPASRDRGRTSARTTCRALVFCLGAWLVTSSGAAQSLCSTARVAGLSEQLVEVQMCMSGFAPLVPFAPHPNISLSPGVRPYAQPSARDAIQAAAETTPLSITSAFRTVADQFVLYRAAECGPAVTPGRSNHEAGRAIDVANHVEARAALEAQGCVWFGNSEPEHFDCPGGDERIDTVRAFQRLWNVNHPDDLIPEDGAFGAVTASRLAASPGDGFPITGCPASPDGDAGVDIDAGPMSAADAGTVDLDAGTTSIDAGVMDVDAAEAGDPGSAMPGSCSCRAARAGRSTPSAALAFGLLLLGIVWSRRRT